jgi:hypothetical protein
MMANAFVGLEPDQVKEIIEQMNKVYPDRTLVLVKPSVVSTHAPNSRRKTHKIKIEVELSTDAFKGESAIVEFGSFVVLHVADKHIKPEFLKEDD